MKSDTTHPIFSEHATYGRYLDVEVALAKVQGALGVIPKEAADAIQASLTVEALDFDRLRTDFNAVGFPIVGLNRQMTEIVPDGFGQYTHWGTTTQDIMDTGLVLALREVMDTLDTLLAKSIEGFAELAEMHKATLISGRSQLQHAVPVTFGYKVAGWALALERNRIKLQDMRDEVLLVQFGGAVGTLVALHPNGPQIRAGLAEALGLIDPGQCWHTYRDGIAGFVSALGVLCGSFEKIAIDIAYMAQTEVGEVTEPTMKGRGTSTAMPNKRNPVLSQQIIVAARAVRGAVPMMLEVMAQDHERGTGIWQTEWDLVPDVCSQAVKAAENIRDLALDLQVDRARMDANIALSGGFPYAEAVMMALAETLGRQSAHDLVEQAVDTALQGTPFVMALMSLPEVSNAIDVNDIERIFAGDMHCIAGQKATEDMLALLKN
ncbi:MAG: adenylosuccinate lyase family protein [Pseudomonadota bacterium]